MKIAVIGGSGFIGTRLSDRLSRGGYKFRIIDKTLSVDYPELVELADVRDLDSLRAAIPNGSVLINLAAEHRDDVRPISLYDAVNVNGAKNICDVAREKSIKIIIFTSSVAVYGFAPVGTDESGEIAPFNDYGRTKFEAETIYRAWQQEAPEERTLVIIRPTVVFGEGNRGNVYNLLKQIASGRFLMVGDGDNRKSMAYVENIAAFLQHSIDFLPGIHIFNFIDKPDFSMNQLVCKVRRTLGYRDKVFVRIPFFLGYLIGKFFDIASYLTGRRFPISSIRVKKFCADSSYNTGIEKSGFISPVSIEEALERTIRYEFIESNNQRKVFHSE